MIFRTISKSYFISNSDPPLADGGRTLLHFYNEVSALEVHRLFTGDFKTVHSSSNLLTEGFDFTQTKATTFKIVGLT